MMEKALLIFMGALGGGMVLVLFYLLTMIPVAMRAQAECLRLGFPHATVDFAYNAYCGRRVDQTDIVVPIAQARAGAK